MFPAEESADQTSSIVRVAAERFIDSMHGLKNPGPNREDSEGGVRLIQSLLSCAEKVSDNQYERALKFLKE